jgi:tetratricopeptide (TPR) repeat protein
VSGCIESHQKLKFSYSHLDGEEILLRSIPLICLASLFAYAAFAREMVVKYDSTNSLNIVRVSTQPPKSKLLKKYHYEIGLQLILEKRFEEAVSFLKPILNETSDFRRTGYLMGYAYQKLNRIEDAIATYEAYLKNDKQDYQAVFNLAYAYMHANQCLKSIEAFNKTLDQKSDYLEAHLHLSTCHNKLGHSMKAEQHLKVWSSRAKSPQL